MNLTLLLSKENSRPYAQKEEKDMSHTQITGSLWSDSDDRAAA